MGVKNVFILMVGDGVIFLFENGELIKREVLKGILKNLVGVGDFMVVGFLCGYFKNKNIDEVFKMGIVIGSVSVFLEEFVIKE